MKNVIWAFFVLIIFSTNIFSDDGSREGTSAKSQSNYPSGYDIRLLNAFGNSGIYNSTANLGFMNPASINSLPNYSVGISYQINTPVNFPQPLEDFSISRVYNFIPQSFATVYHFNNLSFGLSFGQTFNSKLSLGEIPITTAQFPAGTGEFFTPISENTIEKYSLSFAYNFGKLITNDANISVGLRFNLSRFHDYGKILNTIVDNSAFSSGYEIGVYYNSNDNEIIKGLGLSFKSSYSFSISYDSNSLLNPDPTSRDQYYYEVDIPDYIVAIPFEMNFDALIKLNSDLQLTTTIDNIFWNNINSFLSNQLDFSSSLIYNFSNKTTGSVGLLLSNCWLDEEYANYESNEYNAFYMMAGLRHNFNNLNIDISIADSHLISGELRKQFLARFGVGLEL